MRWGAFLGFCPRQIALTNGLMRWFFLGPLLKVGDALILQRYGVLYVGLKPSSAGPDIGDAARSRVGDCRRL